MRNLFATVLLFLCCLHYGSSGIAEVVEITDTICRSLKAVAKVLTPILKQRRRRATDELPTSLQNELPEKYVAFQNDYNCGHMIDVSGKFVQAFTDPNMVKMKDVLAVVSQKVAAVTAWPWIVKIVQPYEEGVHDKGVLCSGTLIKGRWVLTAAHCFDSLDDTNGLVVAIGEHDIPVNISNVYKHEEYDRETHKNDIALLKLPVDVTVEQVSPACVSSGNPQDLPIGSRKCYLTSFANDAAADVPYRILVEIETNVRCSQFVGNFTEKESVMCVSRGQVTHLSEGSLEQIGKGGAIICKGANGNEEVVAVTSRMEQDMIIFTKTDNHVVWMNNVIKY